LSGDFLGSFSVASPYEDSVILVDRQSLGMDDLIFQVGKVGIIESIPALEGSIGYASLAFQQFEYLGENLIAGHSKPSAGLASPL
jgi:hypothetical protein